MAVRIRLDLLLVERGLAESRSRARALILAGRVFSEESRLEKPGVMLDPEIPLAVRGSRRYVSRSAAKLEAALLAFAVEPAGRSAIDVGASTGGFTQVLLEAGVARVLAIDVGHGQLDWSLRQDPRVQVMDGVNARYLQPLSLPFVPDLAVVDVSFISLELVLPAVVDCLGSGGEIVTLIKPQFEVGRGQVGKGGIVRDRALHRTVLEGFAEAAHRANRGLVGIVAASLTGAGGNQEFLAHLRPGQPALSPSAIAVEIDRALLPTVGGDS